MGKSPTASSDNSLHGSRTIFKINGPTCNQAWDLLSCSLGFTTICWFFQLCYNPISEWNHFLWFTFQDSTKPCVKLVIEFSFLSVDCFDFRSVHCLKPCRLLEEWEIGAENITEILNVKSILFPFYVCIKKNLLKKPFFAAKGLNALL